MADKSVKTSMSMQPIMTITQQSSKQWLKESLNIINSPSSNTNFSMLKSAIKNIKIRFTPSFMANLITENAIGIFSSAETFNWIEDKDEPNSFLHKPELFSAFAANANFKIGNISCEHLYLKFCNYYYSFGCDSGPSQKRVRIYFLENYITLRSEKILAAEKYERSSQISQKMKYEVQRESTDVTPRYPLHNASQR